MADLTTQTIQKHTLVLTDEELEALRAAARAARQNDPDNEIAPIWWRLERLGLSSLRSEPTRRTPSREAAATNAAASLSAAGDEH
ncbi:hypothetical protein [Nocardiopsis synnemataformans]|uniref:hypothetical protein n=1 Tax=Nocardiopsis synnemataformans TaxID=61305 RepID=UPI003EBCEDEA